MAINGKLGRIAHSALFGACASGILLMCYFASPQESVGAQSIAPPDASVTITLSNFKFDPRDVSVILGTTVVWIDDTGRHMIEADDGSFQSPILVAGSKFEHRFNKSGTYTYHCSFHGAAGGKEMAGTITVVESK